MCACGHPEVVDAVALAQGDLGHLQQAEEGGQPTEALLAAPPHPHEQGVAVGSLQDATDATPATSDRSRTGGLSPLPPPSHQRIWSDGGGRIRRCQNNLCSLWRVDKRFLRVWVLFHESRLLSPLQACGRIGGTSLIKTCSRISWKATPRKYRGSCFIHCGLEKHIPEKCILEKTSSTVSSSGGFCRSHVEAFFLSQTFGKLRSGSMAA